MRESARFYVELHKLGVNIQCFDVGGGLGVDYEGTRSQSDCSVNYGLNEYANNVIWGIGDACNEHGLPHPTVITESGRAVTAHHTVLVSNVIGVERNEFSEPLPPEADAPRALESMWETWLEMNEPENRRSLREWLHDSQMDLHDVHTQYAHGMLDLTKRAWAEQLYLNICNKIQQQLDPSNRAHRPIIDELQERMADKFYVNFSLFQSMPDARVSISCSRCCRWKGWISRRKVARCCSTSPATPTAPSTTMSTATAWRPPCRCRRTIRRTRLRWASSWSARTRDPRQHAQPVRRHRLG